MNRQIIKNFKELIDENNNEKINDYYQELSKSNFDYYPNWEYIIQHVYLYACLKKNIFVTEMIEKNIIPSLGFIAEAALKPTLIYGKYLK